MVTPIIPKDLARGKTDIIITIVAKLFDIKEIIEPTPKTISEARGLITSKYQNYLEDSWIKELRSKYKVKVNEEVLYSIK